LKPPKGYIKISVDGYSFENPSNVGFGGLLRNDRGSWIQGFSNLVAGLSDIWRGLQLTWDLGYRSIIMKSDYRTTLGLIADTNHNNFHPHAKLFSPIRKLSSLP